MTARPRKVFKPLKLSTLSALASLIRDKHFFFNFDILIENEKVDCQKQIGVSGLLSFSSEFLKRINKWKRIIRHSEKKILVGWIRFARAHRDSNKLPFFLFILLFLDAFMIVIPSMVLTAAAVTITPRRWKLFAFCFIGATVLNNFFTYFLGRHVPVAELFNFMSWVGIESLWEAAEDAIRNYGKYATLIGGLIGLPTQLITMIIGVADSQAVFLGKEIKASIGPALFFAGLGHGLKIFCLCGLVRYGWVKLEKKFESSLK